MILLSIKRVPARCDSMLRGGRGGLVGRDMLPHRKRTIAVSSARTLLHGLTSSPEKNGSNFIRVLLVDDQALVREGVRAFLSRERGMHVVGEASSAVEAVEKAGALRPHVVIMDLMMPDGDGIPAIRRIKQLHPEVRILILTAHCEHRLFQRAAEAGASGYVLKDIAAANLVKAIHIIHQGGAMLSPTIAKQIIDYLFATQDDQYGTTCRVHGLTQRERDVLVKLAEGLSDKEIAAKLFLSEATVKTHLRSIYQRFHVKNRTQAVTLALEKKLLKPNTAPGTGIHDGGPPVSINPQLGELLRNGAHLAKAQPLSKTM